MKNNFFKRFFVHTSFLSVIFSLCVVAQNISSDKFEYRDNQRINTRTNTVAAMYNINSQVYQGTPEQIARQFLNEKKAEFGISDIAELRFLEIIESPAGKHVGFIQTYNGIPIFGSETVVSINRENRVAMVINGNTPIVGLKSISSNVSKEDAIKSALMKIEAEVKTLIIQPASELYIYQDSLYQFNLTWKINFVADKPIGDWQIFVDAITGKVLKVMDISIHYVNGQGKVFKPDPITSLQNTSLTDQDNSDYQAIQGAYKTETLYNLNDPVGGIYRIQGMYARSEDIESPATSPVTSATSSFLYNRSQSGFEETNVYFFIDTHRQYVGELGFSPQWNGYNYIRFDAHGLNGADNSHYVPSGSYIAYGDGGIDDAEDQDVVLHEYGHALHDALMVGTGIGGEELRVSEGIGDYLALSFRRTLSSFQQDHIFNWDGNGETWVGRSLNSIYVYPTDWTFDIYHSGTLWASTMMDMEDNGFIGRIATTKLLLASLSYVSSSSTVRDHINAIFQADRDIYSGSHLSTLATVFYNRGFFYYDQISGTITTNTTWSGNKFITGDVTVNSGVTLTVEPNTFIFFVNGSSLIINGSLEAIGTPPEIGSSGTITFDFNNNGIKVNSGGTANISYADISNATNGIYFNQGIGTISHCNITDCNNGIYISSASPTIQSCTISDNQYGIYITNSYSPNFRTEPIKNNTIQSNSGYGIYLYNSSPTLSGNAVSSCNNGVALFTNCNPMVYNNDITSNSNYGFACYGSSSPTVYYYTYFEIGGYNQFLSNGSDEVRITGTSNPDFGNSSEDGNNSFDDNSGYLMYNSTGSTISAENNWWGSSSGPSVNQIYGSVDYDPYLDEDPNNPSRAVFIDNPSLAVSSVNSTEDLSNAFNAYYGGNFTLAASLFKEYLNQNPKSESALMIIQYYLQSLNMYKSRTDMLSDIDILLRLKLNDAVRNEVISLYAAHLELNGNYDEALLQLESLIGKETEGEFKNRVKLQKAYLLINSKNDTEKAKALFEEVLKNTSDDSYLFEIASAELNNLSGTRSAFAQPLEKKADSNEEKNTFWLKNYPNPFNAETVIKFSLANESDVEIIVYNILGQRITTLVNDKLPAGQHNVKLNAANFASGIYFVTLRAGSELQTIKLSLLK